MTSAAYDLAGNVVTVTDALNVVTSFGYDALNRMTTKSYSDAGTPAVQYCYDGQFASGGSCTDSTGTNRAKGQLTSVGNSMI